MKARITVLTIGVDDLERSLAFYRNGLGLPTDGIIGQEFEHGAVAFFDLQAGLRLALWPRASIAHDTGLPVQAPSATDLTIGHNVGSREEVDAVLAQAGRAGARTGYLRPDLSEPVGWTLLVPFDWPRAGGSI